MKRPNRLRRPEHIQRVRTQGRKVSHKLVQLTVAANTRHKTRCGVIVSKHIGKAVQRNRARRRVQEAIRLNFEHIQPGNDLVFVVRRSEVTEVDFRVLRAMVQELLQRTQIWRE